MDVDEKAICVSGMLIDITRLFGRTLQGRLPTGVDRVSLEHVRYFAGRAGALVRFGGRWVTPDEEDSQLLFRVLLEPDKESLKRARWRLGKNYLLRHRAPAKGSIVLNSGHSGLQDSDYVRRSRRYELRPLYVLHDLIPITHPEYCRAGEADLHRRRLDVMLTSSVALIVNSQATVRILEAYAKARLLKIPEYIVAPLAPARLPVPCLERPMQEPYFVVLGTIEPRKNHLLLLHVWRQLVESGCVSVPHLVIIGQRGWECEQIEDLLERCERLRGHVREVRRCSDADLATWLAHAQALLFPSFEEGYGMPVVEALSLGVPVIASDLPVFRELAGAIPEYLDPLDGPAWKRSVLAYSEPEGLERKAQIQRMAGWQAPTWSEHFQRIEELLARCFAGF